MLRRNPIRRRGNCAFQILLGLAVIAALVAVGGLVSMLTSGAGDAVTALETEIKTIVQSGQTFEAPGTATLELAAGGAMLALHPDGMVGDKKIGVPPANVNYTFTVTDSAGNPVKFEPSNTPRNPQSPFEWFGLFEVESAGTYTIEAKTTDGSTTPAAIMVAAADTAAVDRIKASVASLGWAALGACLAPCGCLTAIAFVIPAIIVRKKAKAATANDTLPPVG